MNFRTKIMALVLSLFVVGWGLRAHEQYTHDELGQVEQLLATDKADEVDEFPTFEMNDIDDPFADFDTDQTRTIHIDEIAPPTLKEKLLFYLEVCKLKSGEYRQEVITHLKQHSNEYLVGSSIVGIAAIICFLKYYSSKSDQP
jgi:hypothetical protein